MTSDKSYDVEQRLSGLIAAGPDASWTDTGSMTGSGWGKGSGYFRYKLLMAGVVVVAVKDLTISGTATVADGTTILSAANGLNSGYRPGANQIRNAWTDEERIAVGSNVESCGLKFVTDGSVQCLGIGPVATTLNCAALLFTDI
jgi:hypothetical protein